MTEQQQPATLDPVTQERWDKWADARISNIVDATVNGLADEVGTVTGQQAKKIFELIEIMQLLAVGNDFLRGRLDQIGREFSHQNGIAHKETTVATIEERHSEHHSESSRRVSVLKR